MKHYVSQIQYYYANFIDKIQLLFILVLLEFFYVFFSFDYLLF